MSLAGGTGSGVGTYYSEFLKNTYPRTALVNTLVWPFSQGEVILQNYNLLLTLNKLYECSDALILLENDNLHQICKRIQVGPKKEVTFDDLNSIIGVFLNSLRIKVTKKIRGRLEIQMFSEDLKFLNVNFFNFTFLILNQLK